MKIAIEKVPEGIRLELHHASDKKPLAVVLTPALARTLLELLATAQKPGMATFRLELEL